MKPFSFLKISASLLALAAMLVTTSAQAETATVKVEAVSGTATVNGQPLTKDSVVKEGDKIATVGATSKVKLTFADSELNVEPNSEVVLTRLQFEQEKGGKLKHNTELDLKQGGLIGNVKKISKSSDYKVKHAQGVAGIRGTAWAVLPNIGVVCFDGSVVVSMTVNGVALPPVTLGPGQMAAIGANGQLVVLNTPREIVALIRDVLSFGEDGSLPPALVRDIQITVTAQAGPTRTSSEPAHTTPPPQYD
ncbi:MAG TPA: FecR domain-containing protein [Verrucomicrobiae bacterium]